MTPSAAKGRLGAFALVAKHIKQGLDGTPFCWTAGQHRAFSKKAKAMGFTLVSKTAIEKEGRELKRGAAPVGSAYFIAPISRDIDLYVLEVQSKEKD